VVLAQFLQILYKSSIQGCNSELIEYEICLSSPNCVHIILDLKAVFIIDLNIWFLELVFERVRNLNSLNIRSTTSADIFTCFLLAGAVNILVHLLSVLIESNTDSSPAWSRSQSIMPNILRFQAFCNICVIDNSSSFSLVISNFKLK
jgi:hypothetical protein